MFLDIEDISPVPVNIEELLGLGLRDEAIDHDPLDNASHTSSSDTLSNSETASQHALYLYREQALKVSSNEYFEYNTLEQHVHFSKSLHRINYMGHYIGSELKMKKAEMEPLVNLVQYTVNTTTRAKLIGTCTLFNELICYLDELLFADVEHLTHFYIEEDAYPITKVYYSQDWIQDQEYSDFELEESCSLDEGEIMIIIVWINEYLSVIDSVSDYVDQSSTKYTTHMKLLVIIEKISERLEILKDRLYNVIRESIEHNDS